MGTDFRRDALVRKSVGGRPAIGLWLRLPAVVIVALLGVWTWLVLTPEYGIRPDLTTTPRIAGSWALDPEPGIIGEAQPAGHASSLELDSVTISSPQLSDEVVDSALRAGWHIQFASAPLAFSFVQSDRGRWRLDFGSVACRAIGIDSRLECLLVPGRTWEADRLWLYVVQGNGSQVRLVYGRRQD